MREYQACDILDSLIHEFMGARTRTKLMYIRPLERLVFFPARYVFSIPFIRMEIIFSSTFQYIYIYMCIDGTEPNKSGPRGYSSEINDHSRREPDKHKLCALISASNVFPAGPINKKASCALLPLSAQIYVYRYIFLYQSKGKREGG